jgi:nucleoside-diphosphate-sugar epimerase
MPRALVAGGGFLGSALASLLQSEGWHVIVGTRSGTVNETPYPVIAFDLADVASIRAASIGECDLVIHCASSGRGGAEAYESVYAHGVQNLAEVFPSARLLFTSSTSVYAQNDGSWVTETSPAEPDRETSRILRHAEDFVLSRGDTVARVAGLYGPGRSVLLRKFLTREAVIEGDGGRFVNQIHRDDAAAALAYLGQRKVDGLFNVTDDVPSMQRDVYEWLAQHFGTPLPPPAPVDEGRKRGVTNKRVSNAKLRALGWFPRYPSFRDAVERDPALVAAIINPPAQ